MVVASKILLVRPASFGYNPQTAESNAFQKRVELPDELIASNALAEFEAMALTLTGLGIEVVILDDKPEPFTPDAVFPNNWFSTHEDGTFCLYPMEAAARRLERDPAFIKRIRSESGTARTFDLSASEREGRFLEGTGSLVLDHRNRIAYACLSSRTDGGLLSDWAVRMGFKPVTFNAYDRGGTPIYHTNVLMCVADRFAVICADSITEPDEKALVIRRLEESGKEIITISYKQMESFAGNMLLLGNKMGGRFLVMSQRAFDSLAPGQIERLEAFAELVRCEIETIEDCGGGSVRCMIAELF